VERRLAVALTVRNARALELAGVPTETSSSRSDVDIAGAIHESPA